MDRRFRQALKNLLNNHFNGTPDHEIKEVLDAISDVIEEQGLVPCELVEETDLDEDD